MDTFVLEEGEIGLLDLLTKLDLLSQILKQEDLLWEMQLV